MPAPPLCRDSPRAFRSPRAGSRTRGSSAPRTRTRSAASSRTGCSSSPTGWAATTPARSPPRWRSTRSRPSSLFHADPRQTWPYRVDRALRSPPTCCASGSRLANDKIREAAERRSRARAHGRDGRRDGGGRDAGRDRARGRQPRLPVARRRAEEADPRSFDRGGDARRASRDDRRGAGGFAHRNVVMRSLGSKEELEPDVYVNKVASGRPLHAVHRRAVGLGARRQDRHASSNRPTTSRRPASC